jgi:predicted transcriptional regulator
MACISADGTLTERATSMLKALKEPRTIDELARGLDAPMYRVRSSLRELMEAKLVEPDGERFRATPTGLARV